MNRYVVKNVKTPPRNVKRTLVEVVSVNGKVDLSALDKEIVHLMMVFSQR